MPEDESNPMSIENGNHFYREDSTAEKGFVEISREEANKTPDVLPFEELEFQEENQEPIEVVEGELVPEDPEPVPPKVETRRDTVRFERAPVPGRSRFQEQFAILNSDRTSDPDREAARQAIQDMVNEAEIDRINGIFVQPRREIRHIGRNSSNLREASRSIFRVAKELEENTDYTDHPEWKGIVGQAARNAASALEYNHLLRQYRSGHIEEVQDAFPGSIDLNADLDDMRQRIERTRFWDSGFRVNEIGVELPASAKLTEKESARAKGPREVLVGIEGKDKEGQLKMVRELLNRLEANNALLKEGENVPTVAALEERLPEMREDVAREVRARIHLKESAAVVRVLTSPDETTQQRYRDLYSEAERNENRRLLRNEDFTELLSQPEMNEIPVQIAFNTLQEVAFTGIELSDGTTKKYMDDKNTEQEREFNNLLRDRLIDEVRYDDETDEEVTERVDKAIDLADKLALATLERHVWMVDNFMGSPISQAFYLHDFRKIGDPGPLVTQPLIWGFGTSFFRQARYEEAGGKRYLFHNAEWRDVKNERRQRYAAYKIHTLQRIMPQRASDQIRNAISRGIDTVKNRKDRNEKRRYFDGFRFEQEPSDYRLGVGEVDYNRLSSTEYNRFLISYVPKVLKVRELLLTETWPVKDMTDTDKISSWYNAFNKMDPDNQLQLRGDFVYGAIYQMLEGGVLEHATGVELRQVFKALTQRKTYSDPVEGEEKIDQFISEDELWDMLNDMKAWHKAGVNAMTAALAGIYQTSGGRR